MDRLVIGLVHSVFVFINRVVFLDADKRSARQRDRNKKMEYKEENRLPP